MKNDKIAIIGAGISGVAAAFQLKKKGYRHITLFEKNDRVGGKC
ncbi:FAD-dependent oxidoreductase, partial [Bacillus sp. JJ1764]